MLNPVYLPTARDLVALTFGAGIAIVAIQAGSGQLMCNITETADSLTRHLSLITIAYVGTIAGLAFSTAVLYNKLQHIEDRMDAKNPRRSFVPQLSLSPAQVAPAS